MFFGKKREYFHGRLFAKKTASEVLSIEMYIACFSLSSFNTAGDCPRALRPFSGKEVLWIR